MSHSIMTQRGHIIHGLAPVADAFSGTVRSDVFNMENFHGCTFLVYKGVGTTGTSTITVNACDNTTPSTRSAIPFRYRANTSSDTWGAVQTATTTGFATTAGSNHLYEIIVDADELGKIGYGFVELTAVELVDSPVLGGIMWFGNEPREPQDVPATALS
jgi:hypothetical protein